jgi:hypothetical protein
MYDKLNTWQLSWQSEIGFWDDHSCVSLRGPRTPVRRQLCKVVGVPVGQERRQAWKRC